MRLPQFKRYHSLYVMKKQSQVVVGYHLMEIYNSEHWLPKFHRILLFFNLLPFLSLISPNVESWNIHIKLFCFVLLQIDCVYKDVLTLLNWFLPNSCSVAQHRYLKRILNFITEDSTLLNLKSKYQCNSFRRPDISACQVLYGSLVKAKIASSLPLVIYLMIVLMDLMSIFLF